MTVHILDEFYLAMSLLVFTIPLQLVFFVLTVALKTDVLNDLAGGSGFFLLAIITLTFGDTYYARNIVVSVFVMVWSARLGLFQLMRVFTSKGDARFDDMRGKVVGMAGFYATQVLWIWTVSLPLVILNSPRVSEPGYGGANVKFGQASDIIGVIIWAFGFLWESTADFQKFFAKQRGTQGPFMQGGVWHYSRAAPYFGEICLQWGIWIIAITPATSGVVQGPSRDALYGAIFGPLFTTVLLLFISGLPLSQKPAAEKQYLTSHGPNAKSDGGSWPQYKDYLDRTSVLIPMPNSVWRGLPAWVKRSVGFEFPFYVFDESKDGPKAIEKAQAKQRDSQA